MLGGDLLKGKLLGLLGLLVTLSSSRFNDPTGPQVRQNPRDSQYAHKTPAKTAEVEMKHHRQKNSGS